MTRRTFIARRAALAGLAAVLAVGGAACGDDDDDGDATEAEDTGGEDTGDVSDAELTAFCEANADLSAAFSREELPEAATVEPLFVIFEENAPEEMADEAAVMVPVARQVLAGEVPPDAFGGDEFAAASLSVDDYSYDNCDFEATTVALVDYAFEDLPETLTAGRNIIRLDNEGNEIHEMALFRRNEGVTLSMEEIFALPEEEGQQNVTEAGFAFAGEPGNHAYLYADLQPGEYAAVCFLPVGATDFAALEGFDPEGEFEPHLARGMLKAFAVE